MKKIKFTSGTMQKISNDYYNVFLFNNGAQIYSVIVSTSEASVLLNKHKNITLI